MVPTGRYPNSSGSSDSDSPILDKRVVVMQKGDKGLGFSIRGPKSETKLCSLCGCQLLDELCVAVSPNLNFRPTIKTPSLQRIGDVDKGGVAEKAGLRGGDHLLKVGL